MGIKTDTGAHLGFEGKLWAAADALCTVNTGAMCMWRHGRLPVSTDAKPVW